MNPTTPYWWAELLTTKAKDPKPRTATARQKNLIPDLKDNDFWDQGESTQ